MMTIKNKQTSLEKKQKITETSSSKLLIIHQIQTRDIKVKCDSVWTSELSELAWVFRILFLDLLLRTP